MGRRQAWGGFHPSPLRCSQLSCLTAWGTSVPASSPTASLPPHPPPKPQRGQERPKPSCAPHEGDGWGPPAPSAGHCEQQPSGCTWGCGGTYHVSSFPLPAEQHVLCVCISSCFSARGSSCLCLPPPFLGDCQRVSCGVSSIWDGTGAGCIPLQLEPVQNLGL